MGLYSKQVCYCTACGKKMEVELPQVIGREWKVCSLECHREIEWRVALSIMNKPYHPPEEPQQ